MNIKKITRYKTLWLYVRKEFHIEWLTSAHPSLIRKYEERYCNSNITGFHFITHTITNTYETGGGQHKNRLDNCDCKPTIILNLSDTVIKTQACSRK
jgi:hypothetical protein